MTFFHPAAAKRSKRNTDFFRDTQAGFLMPPEEEKAEGENGTAAKKAAPRREPGEIGSQPPVEHWFTARLRFTTMLIICFSTRLIG